MFQQIGSSLQGGGLATWYSLVWHQFQEIQIVSWPFHKSLNKWGDSSKLSSFQRFNKRVSTTLSCSKVLQWTQPGFFSRTLCDTLKPHLYVFLVRRYTLAILSHNSLSLLLTKLKALWFQGCFVHWCVQIQGRISGHSWPFLACCRLWGHKERDTTWLLNNNNN